MHTHSLSRFTCMLAVSALALCALGSAASFSRVHAGDDRIVLAQASETNAPPAAPAMDHGHDAPATTPAIPDPNPKLNKKRAAFWGVSFMLATSVAFAIFGTWAIKKTPKSGQQRPE